MEVSWGMSAAAAAACSSPPASASKGTTCKLFWKKMTSPDIFAARKAFRKKSLVFPAVRLSRALLPAFSRASPGLSSRSRGGASVGGRRHAGGDRGSSWRLRGARGARRFCHSTGRAVKTAPSGRAKVQNVHFQKVRFHF